MEKKVALYARVSTKDQSSERQLTDLKKYCADRQWEVPEEYIFVDDGVGGSYAKISKRPNLAACMDVVRKRKVGALVVWSYDRFARSLTHLVNTAEEMRDLRVDFVSYSNNVDTTTAQGRLIFGVLASLAEYVREIIVENVNSGLRNAKAKGVPLGRRAWKSRAGLIAEEKIKEILGLRHLSERRIAQATGIGKSSVHRILAAKVPPHQPVLNVEFTTDEAAVVN